MEKIISLFQRNYDGDRLVRDEVVPGAEWVLAGEGIPTRKYDGVCTCVEGGRFYKRFTVQHPGFLDDRGRSKRPQYRADFVPATGIDPVTGKQEGWVPVGDGPEDQYLRLAFEHEAKLRGGVPDGTYEFLGPKSQGNVEGFAFHELLSHQNGVELLWGNPRTFADLKAWFEANPDVEGIVWHHADGRMVKIKGKDFGVRRVRRLALDPNEEPAPPVEA